MKARLAPFPPLAGGARETPPGFGVTLSQQLAACLEHLEPLVLPLAEPYASCVLFFSVAAPDQDVATFFVRRTTFEAAWREGATRVRQWAWARKLPAVDLRIDWARDITPWAPASQAGAGSVAWALADDDLEQAELVLPTRASTLHEYLEPTRLQRPGPLFTRKLHLHGIHIDPQGQRTLLPRWTTARAPLPLAFQAIWHQLSPLDHGSWPDAHGLDHVCATYALLLLHQHAMLSGLATEALVEAIDQATVHLLHSTGFPPERTDLGWHMAPALRLLTLTRCTARMHANTPCTLTSAHLDMLNRDLRNAASTGDSPWHALTKQALEHSQPSCQGQAHALVDAFLQLQPHMASHGDGRAMEVVACLAIAAIEQSVLSPPLPHQQATARHLLTDIAQRIVVPELGLFLPPSWRHRAAFLTAPSTAEVVTSRRATVQVLLAALALQHLART